jgi:hypothetical protein
VHDGNVELVAIREICKGSPSFYSICEDQVTGTRTGVFRRVQIGKK